MSSDSRSMSRACVTSAFSGGKGEGVLEGGHGVKARHPQSKPPSRSERGRRESPVASHSPGDRVAELLRASPFICRRNTGSGGACVLRPDAGKGPPFSLLEGPTLHVSPRHLFGDLALPEDGWPANRRHRHGGTGQATREWQTWVQAAVCTVTWAPIWTALIYTAPAPPTSLAPSLRAA